MPENDDLLECMICDAPVPDDEGVEFVDRKTGETLGVYCDKCWEDK